VSAVHPDDPTGLSESLAQPLAGRREADPEKAWRVRLFNSLLHGEDPRQIESDLHKEWRLVSDSFGRATRPPLLSTLVTNVAAKATQPRKLELIVTWWCRLGCHSETGPVRD
jgi:hypothetical protein